MAPGQSENMELLETNKHGSRFTVSERKKKRFAVVGWGERTHQRACKIGCCGPFLVSPPWCRPPWLYMIKRYASIGNAYFCAMLSPSLALAWKRQNVRSSRNAVIFPLLWAQPGCACATCTKPYRSYSSISPPNEKPPLR